MTRKTAFVFFLCLIIVIALFWYAKYANTEYIVKINDTAHFNSITDGYIYFGRETCPSCELFLPLLEEVAKEQKVIVYYFDTNHFRNNALLSEDEMSAILTKYKIEEVPVIVNVIAGEVDSLYGATFSIDQVDNIKKDIRNFFSNNYS